MSLQFNCSNKYICTLNTDTHIPIQLPSFNCCCCLCLLYSHIELLCMNVEQTNPTYVPLKIILIRWSFVYRCCLLYMFKDDDENDDKRNLCRVSWLNVFKCFCSFTGINISMSLHSFNFFFIFYFYSDLNCFLSWLKTGFLCCKDNAHSLDKKRKKFKMKFYKRI